MKLIDYKGRRHSGLKVSTLPVGQRGKQVEETAKMLKTSTFQTVSEQLVFLLFLSLASGHDFTVKENERFLTLLYICCRYEAFSEELQIYKRGDFLLNQQSSQRGFPSPPFPRGQEPPGCTMGRLWLPPVLAPRVIIKFLSQ